MSMTSTPIIPRTRREGRGRSSRRTGERTMAVANLFDRLGRPQQVKKTTERRPRNAGFVTQGEKDARIKAFLMEILAKRPVSGTAIQQRGAERGFTRKKLGRAKRLIGIISFKKEFGF